MNKSFRKAVVVALAGSMVVSANAGTVAGNGGSTEVTQILNNFELLTQSAQMYQEVQNTIQQVTMMQQQLKNLIAAPQMVWGQVQADLQAVRQLVAKGQALGYALGNIDQVFAQKFPGYNGVAKRGNYQQAAKEWVATSLDSVNSALSQAGMQADQFATEQSAIDSIQNIAAGSPGSLQIAQAGVMVAGQQVQQLQKLRQLFMAQMQAQNAFLASEQQGKANQHNTNDYHFVPYAPPAGPVFSSGGGKN
jgi:P-type conjugative transfer protein TrbJ